MYFLTDSSDTEISEEEEDEEDNDYLEAKITSEDEFGFRPTKKGWFSSVTGEYLNYHPFK
jgi:hypothetical protein